MLSRTQSGFWLLVVVAILAAVYQPSTPPSTIDKDLDDSAVFLQTSQAIASTSRRDTGSPEALGESAHAAGLVSQLQALRAGAPAPLLPAALAGAGQAVSPIAGCKGFDCIERYVQLPDDNYRWHDTGIRIDGAGSLYDDALDRSSLRWTGYVLNMTSQRWPWPGKINRPVWWHTLVVIVPERLETNDWATLELCFGYNDLNGNLTRIDNFKTHGHSLHLFPGALPGASINAANMQEEIPLLKMAVQKAAYLATRTGAIAASLLNIPNAYETFGDDPGGFRRNADALKGWTYEQFFKHPNEPERIFELPGTKAVVRAMDTITDFTSTLPSGRVSRFGLTGYSKLGTVTWIAGALDARVEAIAPMAIQMHMSNTFTLGGYIPEDAWKKRPGPHDREMLEKAVAQALESQQDPSNIYGHTVYEGLQMTPAFKRLHNIIDPSAWLERLSKPKLLVHATRDTVIGDCGADEPPVYLPLLPGRTSFYEVPNHIHDGALVGALPTSAAFFKGVLLGESAPEFEYSQSNFPLLQATVRRKSAHAPVAVRFWTSRNGSDTYEGSLVQERGGVWTASASPALMQGSFMTLEYEWPSPGFNFTVSTPLKRRDAKQKVGPIVYRDAAGQMY